MDLKFELELARLHIAAIDKLFTARGDAGIGSVEIHTLNALDRLHRVVEQLVDQEMADVRVRAMIPLESRIREQPTPGCASLSDRVHDAARDRMDRVGEIAGMIEEKQPIISEALTQLTVVLNHVIAELDRE